jgi:hypothetical protein
MATNKVPLNVKGSRENTVDDLAQGAEMFSKHMVRSAIFIDSSPVHWL